jgi:hypothetical protein
MTLLNKPPDSPDLGSASTSSSRGEAGSTSEIEKQPSDAPSEKSILDFAWAEWELVQKKIDSVSTFPFTVKTWSVTISAAILGLAKGLDFPIPFLFVSLLIPVVFKAVESRHNQIRDALSKRAEKLELLIAELLPLKDRLPEHCSGSMRREITRLPGVALSIIREIRGPKREKYYWPKWSLKDPLKGLIGNIAVWWRKYVIPHADLWFLCGQELLLTILIVAMLFSQSKPAAEHTNGTATKTPIDSGSPLVSPGTSALQSSSPATVGQSPTPPSPSTSPVKTGATPAATVGQSPTPPSPSTSPVKTGATPTSPSHSQKNP